MKQYEPMKDDELLDTHQAAGYLSVPPEFLQRDQQNATPIPFQRDGSRVLYDPVILDIFRDLLGHGGD